MIRNVDVDLSPLEPGEERDVRVDGDGPFTVSLHCFVLNPPPPGYRTCPECRVQVVNVSQPFHFRAPRQLAGGRLVIRIVDAVGEQEEIAIEVSDRMASPGAMSAAGA
jgi:hypothetical protein